MLCPSNAAHFNSQSACQRTRLANILSTLQALSQSTKEEQRNTWASGNPVPQRKSPPANYTSVILEWDKCKCWYHSSYRCSVCLRCTMNTSANTFYSFLNILMTRRALINCFHDSLFGPLFFPYSLCGTFFLRRYYRSPDPVFLSSLYLAGRNKWIRKNYL